MKESLRHPVRAIREPFGTAGLIVAVVALVLALTGAAFAASGLTGKEKKEVEKIAKKLAGKNGVPGASGQNGAQGAIGAAGKDGAAGGAGKEGISPVGSNFSSSKTLNSVTCTEGGIEYKGATTNLVCNGVKGATGYTEVLPSGKSETGTWVLNESSTYGNSAVAISFPIPLASESSQGFGFNEAETKEIGEGKPVGASGCSGTVGKPTAPLGKLCVYTAMEVTVGVFGNFVEPRAANKETGGYGVSGAILFGPEFAGTPEEPGSVFAWGSWAVTAP